MNLAVDIGNTAVKAAWFKHKRPWEVHSAPTIMALAEPIARYRPKRVIVSSVSSAYDELRAMIPEEARYVELGSDTPLPFENTYRTPRSLGTDRIAAVAGAQALYPSRNVLVIDAGTCVTYEILNHRQQYAGGLISPGLRMRWRAMHTFTARLPLVSLESSDSVRLAESLRSAQDAPEEELPWVAKSTEEALQWGGLMGMAAEINQMIRMYADKFAALQVVTCGGDMKYLQPWISEHVYVPDLVLIGLNSIVQYDGS